MWCEEQFFMVLYWPVLRFMFSLVTKCRWSEPQHSTNRTSSSKPKQSIKQKPRKYHRWLHRLGISLINVVLATLLQRENQKKQLEPGRICFSSWFQGFQNIMVWKAWLGGLDPCWGFSHHGRPWSRWSPQKSVLSGLYLPHSETAPPAGKQEFQRRCMWGTSWTQTMMTSR